MLRLLSFALALLLLSTQASAVTATRVTCAASATTVFANTSTTNPMRVLVRNPTDDSVYLGGTTVTSATGFELASGDAFSSVIEAGDTLSCITASGSVIVHTFVSRY